MAYTFYGPFACPETPCGSNCKTLYPSDGVCYSGPNLPGTGVQTNDSLTVALQKIDYQILVLKTGTTSTTTTHL